MSIFGLVTHPRRLRFSRTLLFSNAKLATSRNCPFVTSLQATAPLVHLGYSVGCDPRFSAHVPRRHRHLLHLFGSVASVWHEETEDVELLFGEAVCCDMQVARDVLSSQRYILLLTHVQQDLCAKQRVWSFGRCCDVGPLQFWGFCSTRKVNKRNHVTQHDSNTPAREYQWNTTLTLHANYLRINQMESAKVIAYLVNPCSW